MKLLDRLVSDVVQNATGYNVRGLVRRVGGRNILLVGGALLAGGAIAAESQRRSSSLPVSEGGRTMPPPPLPQAQATGLPPLPGSQGVVPPPLPPLPGQVAEGASVEAGPVTSPAAPVVDSGSAGDGAALPNATLFSVVRTMVAAALADGELAAAEKALIEQHLVTSAGEEGGLLPEQIAQVRRDLVLPPSAKELAQGLPEGEDEELLLRFATLVIRADGAASAHERAFLDTLAAALGVAQRRRAAIETEIFPEETPP